MTAIRIRPLGFQGTRDRPWAGAFGRTSSLRAMRFLITGGAGFIGSHLSDELLERGHSVAVLDNLSTGAMENIRHLKDSPNFSYTIGTCDDTALVAELVDDADAVCHLAAAVGVELIVESPVRTI